MLKALDVPLDVPLDVIMPVADIQRKLKASLEFSQRETMQK